MLFRSGRRRDGVLTREPAIGAAGALLGIIMFVLSPRCLLGDKRRSFGCRRVAFFHFQYFSYCKSHDCNLGAGHAKKLFYLHQHGCNNYCNHSEREDLSNYKARQLHSFLLIKTTVEQQISFASDYSSTVSRAC